jgi:hypothetical protein
MFGLAGAESIYFLAFLAFHVTEPVRQAISVTPHFNSFQLDQTENCDEKKPTIVSNKSHSDVHSSGHEENVDLPDSHHELLLPSVMLNDRNEISNFEHFTSIIIIWLFNSLLWKLIRFILYFLSSVCP